METEVYNKKGELTEKINIPESIFAVPWNADLVHQVVTGMMANARGSYAHTKDRSEVSGGGKKPWRQKGTGRARHGSSRSPVWVGGGVAHGPRKDKDYSQKINTKMKRKAFLTVLSQKFRDNEIVFVDALSLDKPKTREASAVMANLGKIENFEKLKTKKKNRAILALAGRNEAVEKSYRNLTGVRVAEARNLNALDILTYKYLVLENPEHSLKVLAK